MSELVQNVDLAPTIMQAAGLQVPRDMQGKALNGFFDGLADESWRDAIYYHYYQTGTWHFVEKHLGIRTDRFKLIYFYDIKDWELYDLLQDPNEMNNLYRDPGYSNISKELKSKLKDLISFYDDKTAITLD